MKESPPDRIAELREALEAELGAGALSYDAGVVAEHAGDWSDTERHPPSLVVYPRTPVQVAAALGLIGRLGHRVVVQGGLTGLAGAATPQPGEIALSLARLDRIEEFDRGGGTVTVQAGVVLERLQSEVEAGGWFFPLDLGARGSCQHSTSASLEEHFSRQRHLFFGHLGDGNLHLLSGPYESPESLHRVEELVYSAIGEVGGSISAEHGIGVVKKEFLHFSRSQEELDLMRALKRLFDPRQVLNAGRILETGSN